MSPSSSASTAGRTSTSFSASGHICVWVPESRAWAEIERMFSLLLTRLESFEQAGPVERLHSSINGAIKHLPIRYTLR